MNEKQYVVVRVESEHYAIEISKVNSITQMMEPWIGNTFLDKFSEE